MILREVTEGESRGCSAPPAAELQLSCMSERSATTSWKHADVGNKIKDNDPETCFKTVEQRAGEFLQRHLKISEQVCLTVACNQLLLAWEEV
jgi:hypothetical protein